MRWRYYCDFCGKVGGSSYHMLNHERACTKNPDRVCGLCDLAELRQQPMPVLIEALGYGDAEGLERLRDAAGANEVGKGCPACILAAIRQSPKRPAPEDYEDQSDPEIIREKIEFGYYSPVFDWDREGGAGHFDYQAEFKDFMAIVNAERTRRDWERGVYG
jgi:hypothetical protein